jgi:hypothetical protein
MNDVLADDIAERVMVTLTVGGVTRKTADSSIGVVLRGVSAALATAKRKPCSLTVKKQFESKS